MKTIFEFKKGDTITRVKPSNGYGDRSYMGDSLTFVGIANEQIYFKNNGKYSQILGENHIYNVPLDLWSNGWANYVDPKTLLEGQENTVSSLSIQEQLQKAVEEEDYELATKLQKLLDKL